MTEFKGDLHHHLWTDPYNDSETAKLSFSLDEVVDAEVSAGLDIVGLTDIMAWWAEKPEFREHRYSGLLETAEKNGKFAFDKRKGYSIIYDRQGKPVLHIVRTQEVLTMRHFKHLLVVGLDEDISGGRAAREILKEVKDKGGIAGPDHTGFRQVWDFDELAGLYEDKLIHFLEWNGKMSWPGLPGSLGYNWPTRKVNDWTLFAGMMDRIPIIANSDLSDPNDLIKGGVACTRYFVDSTGNLVEEIFDAIAKGEKKGFERVENYSRLVSPLTHLYHGFQSQRRKDEHSLPDP